MITDRWILHNWMTERPSTNLQFMFLGKTSTTITKVVKDLPQRRAKWAGIVGNVNAITEIATDKR